MQTVLQKCFPLPRELSEAGVKEYCELVMHPALVLAVAVAWPLAAGLPLHEPSSLAGIESDYHFRPERNAG
jgi:hypothetical protein